MKQLLMIILCCGVVAACSMQVDMERQHPDGWHTQVCTDKADSRQLYGSERSAFIRGCMLCVDPTSAPPPRQSRRDFCEEQATSAGYQMGSQRLMFMEGCYGCQ